MQLFHIAKGTPLEELDYEDIFLRLPKETRQTLMEKRAYFVDKAGIIE